MSWEEKKSYYANMAPQKRKSYSDGTKSQDRNRGPAVNNITQGEDRVDNASIFQDLHLQKDHLLHGVLDDGYDSFSSDKDKRTTDEDKRITNENKGAKFVPESSSPKERSILEKAKLTNENLIGLIIMIILLAIAIMYKFFPQEKIPVETYTLENFTDEMKKLYPTQDPIIWEFVKAQFEGVKHFSRPAVFMVAHYNHPGKAVQVVEGMGKIAALYLNNGTEEMKPVIVNHQELDLRDHGELLTLLKSKFIQNKVMIIDGIEKVPGIVAQGFRYFCDEYTPMIEESVIFFTVNLHSCKNSITKMDFLQADRGSLSANIEDCLTDSWESQLESHVLHPVLIRVVNNVLKIL